MITRLLIKLKAVLGVVGFFNQDGTLRSVGLTCAVCHSTVDNSLRIVERVKPKRAFFTHICHDLPHAATNATLPKHVQLSYDGMKLEFEI